MLNIRFLYFPLYLSFYFKIFYNMGTIHIPTYFYIAAKYVSYDYMTVYADETLMCFSLFPLFLV